MVSTHDFFAAAIEYTLHIPIVLLRQLVAREEAPHLFVRIDDRGARAQQLGQGVELAAGPHVPCPGQFPEQHFGAALRIGQQRCGVAFPLLALLLERGRGTTVELRPLGKCRIHSHVVHARVEHRERRPEASANRRARIVRAVDMHDRHRARSRV